MNKLNTLLSKTLQIREKFCRPEKVVRNIFNVFYCFAKVFLILMTYSPFYILNNYQQSGYVGNTTFYTIFAKYKEWGGGGWREFKMKVKFIKWTNISQKTKIQWNIYHADTPQSGHLSKTYKKPCNGMFAVTTAKVRTTVKV